MNKTLLLASYRYLLRHPWQLGLAILGVALGVAVVVAIDLANASAKRAFTLSSEAVAGRASDEILGGPTGLDESLYLRLRTELAMRNSAPVVEGYVSVPALSGMTLHILGIDPLAEAHFRPFNSGLNTNAPAFFTQPGAAILSAETAREHRLREGDHLRLRIGGRFVEAQIIGLLEPQDQRSSRALEGLMIVDIATAQEWFQSSGKLTRIDLDIPSGPQGDALREQIRALLPAGAALSTPAARTNALSQMTSAFELNLTALSLLALVVGMFLIYNTITFSVVQRRGLFGTLRCLGVSPRQIFMLVLSEALLLGMLGSALGLGLGIALGSGLVRLVTQTINDLYFSVTVRSVSLETIPLVKGVVLGMGATLLAAAVPAMEATSTAPRTVLRRSSYEEQARRMLPRLALLGIALLLLGSGMLLIPGRSLILSFAGLFTLTFGAAAITPMALTGLMWLWQPVLGRLGGLLGRMATRDVLAHLSRTSVAIAALMIAVSVTIGVGLMVSSFRSTVVSWLENTLRADIYVSSPDATSNRINAPLPPDLIQRLSNFPGIERVRRYRSVEVDSSIGPSLLVALDVTPADHPVFQFVSGDVNRIWAGWQRGEVLISEPLSLRHGLQAGDTIMLRSMQGMHEFRIAGVFYDYGTDRGVVMFDLARYQAEWQDQGISSLALYAQPSSNVDTLVTELRGVAGASEQIAETAILIRSNRALREASLAIFDRTFAITSVLQLLATIVAFIGILAALMALQLERSRELGVLRANGLTPGQLWLLVLSQTGLMGLSAGLLAIPTGLMMASVLVFVINRRSFGWTLQFEIDPRLLLQAMLVAIIAALLAGIYPAWRMARSSPALALREE